MKYTPKVRREGRQNGEVVGSRVMQTIRKFDLRFGFRETAERKRNEMSIGFRPLLMALTDIRRN